MKKQHFYIISFLALFIALVGTQVSFAQGTDSDNPPADSKEIGELEELLAASNSRSSTATNCTDDSFEPNNTLATATVVNASTAGTVYSDLKVCGLDDVDVFKVTVPANHQVKFDLSFVHAISNINFGIYDATGTLLGYGVSSNDGETDTITNSSTSAVEWVVIVVNIGSGNNTYSLKLTSNPPCSDDAFEENDGLSTTATIAVPSNNPDLVLCDTDADFYSITIPAGAIVRVDVLFDHSISDLDLHIYDSSDSQIDSSTTYSNDEYRLIQNSSGASATYKLVVFNADYNFADNPYTLNISNETACVDDSYEENDTVPSTTALVLPSNNANLMFCNQDQDNYLITVPAGTDVIIDLKFSNDISNLELYVYENVTGFPLVVSSTSFTDNEQVSFQNTTSSPVTYWVQVYTFDTHLAYNPYALNIREGKISKVYLPIILK